MRAVPIPADWKVDAEGRAYARQKRGWDDPKIDTEEERMRDHAISQGRKQVCWKAAWRKWVMSKYQDEKNTSNPNGKSLLAAFDRLIDPVAASNYVPGSSGPKPVELDWPNGQTNLRLISKG